ncbi:MAG: thermonuclease family protein [Bacteroidota bacterium]|nr:thermonuclease family protein [Bacteroidota bacterium]
MIKPTSALLRPHAFTAVAVVLLCCALTLTSCEAQKGDSPSAPGDADHVIGVYGDFRVVDGDTFRIEGLERGVRFLFIDTEEVPRGDHALQDLARLRETWPGPYYEKRGDRSFPVKMGSPMGWDTAEWARTWFADVDSIRLERDSEDNVYGYFGRWLALVYAKKNGSWVLYNLECVRQGHSPYYGKYGFSARFHDAFVEAQDEARAAQRGVWNPVLQHYPDYDERMEWWNGRGEDISRYLENHADDEDYYFMGRDGEMERLALAQGEQVVVFGAVDWIDEEETVNAVRIPHKDGQTVVVRLPGAASMEWVADIEQQYVYARGRISGSGQMLTLDVTDFDAISRRP